MDAREFDVLVIGAGPSGIIAAIIAAERGLRVGLLERNDLIGRKLLLAGGGRCNVSSNVGLEDFLKGFGRDGRFLRQAMMAFDFDALQNFLDRLGAQSYQNEDQLFIRGGGRVFVDALGGELRNLGVKVMLSQRVAKIIYSGQVHTETDQAFFDVITEKDRYLARKVILALGGRSYPITGSSGDGFRLARELGHNVVTPTPAMGPIRVKKNPFAGLAGISLERVRVEVFLDSKRVGSFEGGLLLTHHGLSGPAILNASIEIARGFQKKQLAEVKIYLFPDERIDDPFAVDKLPKRIRNQVLAGLGVDLMKKPIQFTRTQRHELLEFLNGFKLEVAELSAWEEAMVTAGGVALSEVDPKSMASKKVDGLYIAGELLDLAGNCGGYNIHSAFATGYLAGQNV